MSRLIDPLLCPDCRGRVLPGGQCSACGLLLNGAQGQELFRALLHADEILERMRAAQQPPVAIGAPVAASAPVVPPPPGVAPAYPMPAPASRAKFTLPAATGRSLVLLVAAVLIFVAASLFLAVAWMILPLVIKALIMLAVTTLFGLFGWWLNHKGLRGSGEAVWGLTGALIALDVSAAHRSGLLGFDALDGRHVAGVTGLLLVGFGLPAALWAQRSPARRSIAAEALTVLGVFAALVGWVFQGPWNDGPQQAVAIPLVAGLAFVLRDRLRWVAWGVLGLTGLTWLVLVMSVLPNLDETRAHYWLHLRPWPLVVAAVYAAIVAMLGMVPRWVRVAGACAALGVLTLAIWLPPRLDTWWVVLVAVVLAAIAALRLVPDRVWSTAGTYVGLGVGLVGVLLLGVLPWTSVPSLGAHHIFAAPLRTPVVWHVVPDGLVLPLLGLSVSGAATLLAGRPWRRHLVTLIVGPIAYAVAGLVSDRGWPLPVAVSAFALAAGAAGASSVLKIGAADAMAPNTLPAVWALGWATNSLALAFVLAAGNDLVSAVLGSVVALALWAACATQRTKLYGGVIGALAAVITGYSAIGWVNFANGGPDTQTLVLALLAAVILIASRWIASGLARLGVEVGAAVVGLVALAFGLADGLGSVALALTVIGSALALVASTDPLRRPYAWPAAGVLATATLARFVDNTSFPEAYCLPAALVLIGAGVWQLRRNPAESSWRVLAAGLSLLLVPSLLIAMEHPASVRTVLVALTAALALTTGIALRWQAPLLIGVGTLTALALRFLLPLARDLLTNPFGPWLLFGALGLTCLIIGIMWEQTQRGVRRASHYVGSLR